MNNNKLIVIGAVVIVIAGAIMYAFSSPSATGPGIYDDFAQCLNDNGAVFYGAFWCPHCKDQKRMFGASQSKLPYVECSTPDGRGQLPECEREGITSYPTWVFGDGSTSTGALSLETLAQRTGCALSSDTSPATTTGT